MNLDFVRNNFRFTARVSAIIYNVNMTKVLLFKSNEKSRFYMLPGGRVKLYEDSKTAISREVTEELGYDLKFKLCSVQENFIKNNYKNIMQYCFCYKAIYDQKGCNEKFKCLDNEKQYFYWVDINSIDEYKIVPKSSYNLIRNNADFVEHIIEKE